MTAFQGYLYEYIEDERSPALQSNGEFLLAERLRDEAVKKLTGVLTEEQMQMFISYSDAENRLNSILLRYVFQETLTIIHDLFHISL